MSYIGIHTIFFLFFLVKSSKSTPVFAHRPVFSQHEWEYLGRSQDIKRERPLKREWAVHEARNAPTWHVGRDNPQIRSNECKMILKQGHFLHEGVDLSSLHITDSH